MGVHLGGQGEAGLQVSLVVSAQSTHDGGIHLFLTVLLLLRGHLLWGVSRKEGLLRVCARLLLGLVAGKVSIGDGREVCALEVDLGGCADAVPLVHALQRNAVDGVRASDEEEATLQLLQEDNPSASELARKQDQHGSRGDVLLQLGSLLFHSLLHALGAHLLVAVLLLPSSLLACLTHGCGAVLCTGRGCNLIREDRTSTLTRRGLVNSAIIYRAHASLTNVLSGRTRNIAGNHLSSTWVELPRLLVRRPTQLRASASNTGWEAVLGVASELDSSANCHD